MRLFEAAGSDPRYSAQRNLMGRTHYVDPDTLKYHKSRILGAYVVDNGLLFAILESVALDFHPTKRGFRPVVFNVFGQVVSRVTMRGCSATRRAAEKTLWEIVNGLDAKKLTLQAINDARVSYIDKLDRLEAQVKAL